MRHYMELCLQGESSIPQRKIVLQEQRKIVEDKIDLLRNMLIYIDSKMDFFTKVRLGEIDYRSNLTFIDDDDDISSH